MSSVDEDYEIILVEDGSPDKSWEAIQCECRRDKRVKGIRLSRNFGQHYAMTAGLDNANGEWVIVMDCDLQDQPSEIPKLYAEAQKGFDIVQARRAKRKDPYLKKVTSVLFYKVLSYLTNSKQDPTIANYGIYHQKVISVVKVMREQIRYFPTMINFAGFTRSVIDVNHGQRLEGKSNYNYIKLMSLALDVILTNSERPIRLIVKGGFFISFMTFLAAIVYLIMYLTGKITVLGFTSIIISIWFLGGLIMMMLGVIGLYVGKTFQGVKNRPIYVISQTNNL